MLKISVTRSIKIIASADKIYAVLGNFNHWKYWSPWLTQEPEAVFNVSENAKYYDWEGIRIGSGNMKVMNEIYLNSVEYDLNFLKPWKFKAKIKFKIKDNRDSCIITWIMDSSIPVFMFRKRRKMETYIAMNYKRGLEMLKDYIEKGVVISEVSIIGEQTFEGIKYIGLNTECSFDELGSQMKINFQKMRTYLVDQEQLALGLGFSIYNNWDFKNQLVNYTSGFSVTTLPKNMSAEFITGVIPKTNVFSLKHTGAYKHVVNAWATSESLSIAKIYTPKKKTPFFEVYLNNPNQVCEKELITEVHFPLK